MMGVKPRIKVQPPSAFSFVRASRPKLGARKGFAENGAALVVVLMMTAVLTVLIVAFLGTASRNTAVSSSDATRQRVEQLAQTALHELVRNLQDEMIAGSMDPQTHAQPFVPIDTENGPNAGNLLFPAIPQSAVPCVTQVSAPTNLLKWSSRDAPFYTARFEGAYPFANVFPPGIPASASSTLDTATGGGVVSASRWNAACLLNGEFPLPDWILISQKGKACSDLSNNVKDPVVGRYAYMIYDEGALANLNVVGFPSNLDAADPFILRAKGTPRLLDLFPILAASGMSPADAIAFNDALVQWRDAGLFASGSYPANFSADVSRYPFVVPWRLAPLNRTFLSRKELIKSVMSRFPGPAPARQAFLQFVGTFSRALDQPSLQPPQPGTGLLTPPPLLSPTQGGNDGAGWDALYPNHAQHLNPPFLQIRVKSPFFRIDGTQARVGQPLVFKRFPLGRLAEVNHRGTASAGSRIERMFGLTRENSGEPWTYRPAQASILTLNEVANLPAAEAREPDFIELLKASVYAGVLASGASSESAASEAWMHSLDCAVLQIAANIIDQYDRDHFPTRIKFNFSSGERTVSGVESLPYLYSIQNRIGVVNESFPVPTSTGGVTGFPSSSGLSPFLQLSSALRYYPGSAWIWQSVALWNPHYLGDSSEGPTQFRLFVDTGGQVRWRPEQEGSMPIMNGSPLSGIGQASTFDRGGLEGSQFRVESQATPDSEFLNPVQIAVNMPHVLPENGVFQTAAGTKEVGVLVASVDRIFSVAATPRFYAVVPSRYSILSAPDFHYRLEYLDSDSGTWITYDEKMCPLEQAVYLDSSRNRVLRFSDPRAQRAQAAKSQISSDASFFNLPDVLGSKPDADGVVRRASGVATPSVSSPTDYSIDSRPRILNRPFRSVGEMACAFSGNEWKQLDFSTPETGFAGLLDVFSIYENNEVSPLISGLVNLNTKHLPVLQGAFLGTASTLMPFEGDISPDLDPNLIDLLSKALVARTSKTPLRNRSELAGRWSASAVSGSNLSGKNCYSGFASDFEKMPEGEASRHVVARTLAEIGDTRVWNLLMDIVVQAGRFPNQTGAKANVRNFIFEAEKRIWVHLALDRLTGEVLDWQLEVPED